MKISYDKVNDFILTLFIVAIIGSIGLTAMANQDFTHKTNESLGTTNSGGNLTATTDYNSVNSSAVIYIGNDRYPSANLYNGTVFYFSPRTFVINTTDSFNNTFGSKAVVISYDVSGNTDNRIQTVWDNLPVLAIFSILVILIVRRKYSS